jgi:hypothetical protein
MEADFLKIDFSYRFNGQITAIDGPLGDVWTKKGTDLFSTTAGLTTGYAYYATGQLHTITLPDEQSDPSR